MSTATTAELTGADAINALAVAGTTRTLEQELRIFKAARAEHKALTEMINAAQAHLIERLEAETDGHLHVDGDAFTVVRPERTVLDTDRVLPVIRKLRLWTKLTHVVVNESAVRAMIATGLFPELAKCSRTDPTKPYVKIS